MAGKAGRNRSLKGKRVLVMGLGRFGGGVGVARWLCSVGAAVTVTDIAPADQLAESVASLDGLPAELHLGGHDEADLDRCDLLVVNPAVPEESPFLAAAAGRRVPMTTEINLFLERCPARLVGITGSVGKSTTTAMAGEVLGRRFTTHVGGNIGKSLLEELQEGRIGRDDVVVLELSSFQLAWTPTIGLSPQVALVTNLLPNHLDRHGTLAAYAAAKKNIYRFQTKGDVLIVNADDPVVSAWAKEAPGKAETFSLASEPFDLLVPGEHNQLDAQAAWAIARALGVPREAGAEALKGFRGLPHRLCLLGEKGGVRFFDDSKATTPSGTVVAVKSFPPGRVVAIVGGYDKHIPLDEMFGPLSERCKAVIATGQVGGSIAEGVRQAIAKAAGSPQVIFEPAFDQAVAAALRLAEPGDVVLLSPGCASYDQFANYIQRGLRFAELVDVQPAHP